MFLRLDEMSQTDNGVRDTPLSDLYILGVVLGEAGWMNCLPRDL